jgi:hypothetical protein
VQPTGPAAAAGAAPAQAPAEASEAPALTLGWRVALVVWALGFGGLMLYEVAGFAVRAIRAAVR